jgi:hypothetical protein
LWFNTRERLHVSTPAALRHDEGAHGRHTIKVRSRSDLARSFCHSMEAVA